MKRALLALGSNLGDRQANLARAIAGLIEQGCEVLQQSSVIETVPWGTEAPERYLNGVVEVRTDLDPWSLLATTQSVERALGRTPGARNAPRPMDVDIVAYEGVTVVSATLTLPHPRLAGRDFVWGPLAELDIDWFPLRE